MTMHNERLNWYEYNRANYLSNYASAQNSLDFGSLHASTLGIVISVLLNWVVEPHFLFRTTLVLFILSFLSMMLSLYAARGACSDYIDQLDQEFRKGKCAEFLISPWERVTTTSTDVSYLLCTFGVLILSIYGIGYAWCL